MLKKIKGTFVMLGECIRMSFSNIMGNRMRSFLTILGILIGVSAVIALITTISGFSGSLTTSFNALGAGSLTVSVTGSDLKGGLSPEDLDELAELDEIEGVTPSVSIRSATASRGGAMEEGVNVSGKNAYYFHTRDNIVARGREFNIYDERDKTFVCLINQDMVDKFYFGVDPIDTTLCINGIPFTVVGLLSEDSDQTIASLLTGGTDILIPYTTALKLNNENTVSSFTSYVAQDVSSEQATDALEAKLDAMFSFEEDCYSIMDMSSIEDTLESMLSMVSGLLAGIASIALLVGGIGIMNMMLTTVSERTAEIGLKKALGAIPWQIQIQFLIESFLLSLIGGILGIGLGLALSYAMCQAMGMEFALSTSAIALGAGFSAAVGIIFGWAPARKASRLNPIDALRAM